MIPESSPLYKLFKQEFFLSAGDYPRSLHADTPGQATYLALKLNQARKQHFKENPGMKESHCPYTAKAVGFEVIISFAGRARRETKSDAWVSKFLEEEIPDPRPVTPKFASQFGGLADNRDDPGEPDRQEELIQRILNGGDTPPE